MPIGLAIVHRCETQEFVHELSDEILVYITTILRMLSAEIMFSEHGLSFAITKSILVVQLRF